jgi:hypothetical protein
MARFRYLSYFFRSALKSRHSEVEEQDVG